MLTCRGRGAAHAGCPLGAGGFCWEAAGSAAALTAFTGGAVGLPCCCEAFPKSGGPDVLAGGETGGWCTATWPPWPCDSPCAASCWLMWGSTLYDEAGRSAACAEPCRPSGTLRLFGCSACCTVLHQVTGSSCWGAAAGDTGARMASSWRCRRFSTFLAYFALTLASAALAAAASSCSSAVVTCTHHHCLCWGIAFASLHAHISKGYICKSHILKYLQLWL